MCQQFSGIVTEDKVHFIFGVNSHEDILELLGIKDINPIPNFVRIEFLYTENAGLDFSKWELKIDQDEVPDWFDKEYTKKEVIKFFEKLPHIKEGKVVDILDRGVWVCAGEVKRLIGVGSIGLLLGQVGEMHGSSQVGEMHSSSRVGEMRGSSRVGKMLDSSQVIKDKRIK